MSHYIYSPARLEAVVCKNYVWETIKQGNIFEMRKANLGH